jgi:hypothetical protein
MLSPGRDVVDSNEKGGGTSSCDSLHQFSADAEPRAFFDCVAALL